MKIAIIGAGMIGGTLAHLLAPLGHEVAVSNSRGPDSLKAMVSELGPTAHAMAVDDAAKWGELIVLAVPWRTPEALPPADAVAGKIVIDAMNPYRDGGGLYDLADSSSSEETQRRLPGARLVKAFNTIFYRHLATEGHTDLPEDDRRAVFVASDDPEAKATVSQLIRDLGYGPVDAGALRDGVKLQPGSTVYNQQLTARDARKRLASTD